MFKDLDCTWGSWLSRSEWNAWRIHIFFHFSIIAYGKWGVKNPSGIYAKFTWNFFSRESFSSDTTYIVYTCYYGDMISNTHYKLGKTAAAASGKSEIWKSYLHESICNERHPYHSLFSFFLLLKFLICQLHVF